MQITERQDVYTRITAQIVADFGQIKTSVPTLA
jgi:hypothetical protein